MVLIEKEEAFPYEGIMLVETMRIYRQKILFLEDHWQRLLRGLSQWRALVKLQKEDLISLAIRDKLENHILRVIAFPWNGCWTYRVEIKEFSSKSLDLRIIDKNLYWTYGDIKPLQFYHQKKDTLEFRENILYNTDNFGILEGAFYNFFLKKENQLTIPYKSDPYLKGIFFNQVINMLNNKIQIKEKRISVEDVVNEDLFICNSVMGLKAMKKVIYREEIFLKDTTKANKFIKFIHQQLGTLWPIDTTQEQFII